MNYNIIIKFLYTLTTIIIGTIICILYIENSYKKIIYYYSYDEKTTGKFIIKKCLDNMTCYYIEYIVNDVKYSKNFNQSEDLITDKKVDILYKKITPEISMVDDVSYFNNYIILIISIIILILIWIFFLIIILKNNEYIHLFYAISFSIYLSYLCIINIYNYNISNVKNIVKSILLIICLLIIWFFLIFNIPYIIN
jgi:hypothetical protein